LPGDFNNDGKVDAADYTVWRDNLGGSSSALNGMVRRQRLLFQADYDLWKTNFGGWPRPAAFGRWGGARADQLDAGWRLVCWVASCGRRGGSR